MRQFLKSASYLATSRDSHVGMPLLPSADLHTDISLRQESLRHIFTSPGYAPGTIAVNFTWIEREFDACQTHRSMYPSICNRFQVIQPVSLKVRHFSTLYAHFGFPWVRPWDNRGKCYTVVKRIQCL